jgi:hypothetical protein
MPKKAPKPDAGNAPEGILEPPEPVVTPDPTPEPVEVPLEASQMPPGVYSGVWPNLVLTATVDDNGVMVPVPEATDATS